MPAGSRLATCTTTAACPAGRWSGRPSSGFWRTSRPGRFKSSLSTRSHGAWIATSSGGQTEVANPLNLEATNATQSPLRRTDRYPNQSWRNFRLIGTQLFNLADHVAVAWRRREDVEAQRLGWGHRCAAVALFGTQAEGVRADGAILPDHRHSRGGTGWLLDSSGAAERENRELRCRCGLARPFLAFSNTRPVLRFPAHFLSNTRGAARTASAISGK